MLVATIDASALKLELTGSNFIVPSKKLFNEVPRSSARALHQSISFHDHFQDPGLGGHAIALIRNCLDPHLLMIGLLMEDVRVQSVSKPENIRRT